LNEEDSPGNLVTLIGVPVSASFFHSSSQQQPLPAGLRRPKPMATARRQGKIEMRLFILCNLQLEIINFLYKNLRKAEL
jgi:hypothetical protein